MRRASSVPSPPRGVDTAGMVGLVGSVNDATQQAACDDTNVDAMRSLSQLPGYRHENPAACNNNAIRWAARNGRCDVVRYLCELPAGRGVNPAAGDNSPIRWAAYNGHVDVVRYLCELPGDRGVNPAADDNAAISWAAHNGHVDVVRYLCELPGGRGVNPGADDNYAIRSAADDGHVDVVRYLCELPGDRGVNPGADDNDAIQRAAAHNHLHVVRHLCAALPPHFQHVVPCVFRARHVCGCDGRCYCHAHRTQSVFSKFHTLFARLSARRSLLVLYALVRGRRCGYKPGQSGMDRARHMEGEGRFRRPPRRRRTREAFN